MSELLNGVRQFQKNHFPQMKPQFEGLAAGQSPKALFITCSDSRIDPNLLTGTQPGELFVIRNAGNIVPNPDDHIEGVLGTIEYAASVLQVPEIIVCGHSHCGAMSGLMALDSLKTLPMVDTWVRQSEPAIEQLNKHPESERTVWQLIIENVKLQVQRLAALDCVKAQVDAGKMTLSGWVYEFETGDVHVVDVETGTAEPINRGDQ